MVLLSKLDVVVLVDNCQNQTGKPRVFHTANAKPGNRPLQFLHPSLQPHTLCAIPIVFPRIRPNSSGYSREVCRPTSPRPDFGSSSTSRKTKRQKSGAQTKRQGGEIRSSRKWYKGGTFGLLFLLLVRGNDAGGEQAHLVRRRRRQRRKKTTALKWRDRTAGCAADGSRFRAKRWCRGLA